MLYLNDDIAGFDLESALPLLSPWRREQALRFKHELGQKTCAMAYLLLRQGLQQEYGLTEPPLFTYNEHGKPSIDGHPEIHFNLSHCRAGVVCALSNRPIGVDIECLRQYRDSLAHYTMNDRELHEIQQTSNPDIAFTRLWTMKEAVVKWRGLGIAGNLKQALDGAPPIMTIVNEERGYVLSVCQ